MSGVGSSSSNGTPRSLRRRAAGRAAALSRAPGSSAGNMRLYADDSAGLKVEPIVVLILSIIFIGSVFALHIVGKFIRG